MMEFIFYGIPLTLAGLCVIAWLWRVGTALWIILRKSKRDDLAERASLSTFEQVKADMFGTRREKAVDELHRNYDHLRTLVGCLVVNAVLAWIVYGAFLLWRRFFG